jgi:hypothetical protein
MRLVIRSVTTRSDPVGSNPTWAAAAPPPPAMSMVESGMGVSMPSFASWNPLSVPLPAFSA